MKETNDAIDLVEGQSKRCYGVTFSLFALKAENCRWLSDILIKLNGIHIVFNQEF